MRSIEEPKSNAQLSKSRKLRQMVCFRMWFLLMYMFDAASGHVHCVRLNRFMTNYSMQLAVQATVSGLPSAAA